MWAYDQTNSAFDSESFDIPRSQHEMNHGQHDPTPSPSTGSATPAGLLSPLALLTPLGDETTTIMTEKQQQQRRGYIQQKPCMHDFSGRPAIPRARSAPSSHVKHEEEQEWDAALDPIAYKRRRNTLAARRTRQRKAAYLQALEEQVEVLTAEVTTWRERAMMAQELLRGRGIDFSFDDIDKELAHIK
ncbi:Imprinted and ancient [Mycena sanguinolenta]|uniref:Imprinted and ancient n=1 Tax=Mycena sanguinolenta TaxID=230812 RepID=A0A8H6Z4C5_9AGAR|nr:Imprinted and ancient [Mycena sanguinolenta]